jgi:hypothetical protein
MLCNTTVVNGLRSKDSLPVTVFAGNSLAFVGLDAATPDTFIRYVVQRNVTQNRFAPERV